MEITFITRTKSDEYDKCFDWIKTFTDNKVISNFIIISNCKKDNSVFKGKIIYNCYDENPNSATSLNLGIIKMKEIYEHNVSDEIYFIIASKEVDLKNSNINELLDEIAPDGNLLVTGYKFKIKKDKRLNQELEDYYNNKKFIAYQVPWNTCAIWNYKLFKEYVKEFDDITYKNPFKPVCVCIDNVCSQTDHRGMEDGLAIAKASSQKQEKIYYKLLDKKLPREVKSSDEQRHREKLARKEIVLRNFMEVRNYSVEDLKNSTLERE